MGMASALYALNARLYSNCILNEKFLHLYVSASQIKGGFQEIKLKPFLFTPQTLILLVPSFSLGIILKNSLTYYPAGNKSIFQGPPEK